MGSTRATRDIPPKDGSAWQTTRREALPCSACRVSLEIAPVVKWDGSCWQMVWDCQECGEMSYHPISDSVLLRLSTTSGPWSLAQQLPGAPHRLVGE